MNRFGSSADAETKSHCLFYPWFNWKEELKTIYERKFDGHCLGNSTLRHYLLGRKFVVRTDHKSLKYLLEQREVNLEYQKWLHKLMGYEFEIVYKHGTENKATYGLSHIVHPAFDTLLKLTVPKPLQLEDILRSVENYSVIQQFLKNLSDGKQLKKGYRVVEGRLLYL
ncbi:hypothetical protein N665_1069s0004 [Sinapis alba]|nr:hypothetical protein N665_1069s0004 [Sinapis alba]